MDGRALIALFALAACGGGSDSMMPVDDAGTDADAPDAGPPGPCWPVETSTPAGEVEVGTGVTAYEPMPDSLPLVYGQQMGYHITTRARIRGMNPGTLNDAVDANKRNPRSKFWAIALEDNAQINYGPCGYRIYYEPASDGDGYTFPAYIEIRFDTTLQLADIVDKQYRVIVEVIDVDGKYAKGEKVITATAPQE